MRHQHFSTRFSVSAKKLLRNYYGIVGAIFFAIIIVSLFVISRGAVPPSSELSYIEHSILGEKAGSVVPASCDAVTRSWGWPDGSHFPGDCLVPCPPPNASVMYDPFFDPGMTACPSNVNAVCGNTPVACSQGTFRSGSAGQNATNWYWICDGSGGGSPANCTQPFGKCSSPLVLNTCAVGTVSNISSDAVNNYWRCNSNPVFNGQYDSCVLPKAVSCTGSGSFCNGAPGTTINWQSGCTGSPGAGWVDQGGGTWHYNTGVVCGAAGPGACGSAGYPLGHDASTGEVTINGDKFSWWMGGTSVAPGSNLCNPGTPSSVVVQGEWTVGPAWRNFFEWSCTSGGNTATCGVWNQPPPPGADCGTANLRTYNSGDTSYGIYTQCNPVGSETSSAFPAQGTTVTWWCDDGTASWGPCTATRRLQTPTLAAPVPGACGSGSISLSWNSSLNATSYRLQHRLGAGVWSTIYTGPATSFTDPGLTGGATYGYRVRAINADGNTVDSPEVTAVAPAAACGGPDNSQCVGITGIAASYAPGAPISTTVTFKNTGANTWLIGGANPTKLGSRTPPDNLNWGVNRVLMGSNVTTNNNAAFTINTIAPATAGTYPFDWMMVKEGSCWYGGGAAGDCPGEICSATINVVSGPTCGTRAQAYPNGTAAWPAGTFCSSGASVPASPIFPGPGSAVNWTCGGGTVNCSATQDGAGGGADCTDQIKNWTISGLACSGNTTATLDGATTNVSNDTPGRRGSRLYLCTGASNLYTAQNAGTCSLTECNDGVDNADPEDTLIDCADPGCHTDNNAANPLTCNIDDNNETDPLPDLRPTGRPTPVGAGPFTVGVPMEWRGTPENRGSVPTGGTFNDRFGYASVNNPPSFTSFPSQPPQHAVIGANGTGVEERVWFTPITSGDLYVEYCTDLPANAINEGTNENNNCQVSNRVTVNPAPAFPDLTSDFVAVSFGGAMVNGQTVTFSATARNIGTANTGAGFTDRFRYRYSSGGAWINLSSHAKAALAPAAWHNDTSNSLTLSATGYFDIEHCADSTNAINTETNESNNCLVTNYNISAAPIPDLTASQISGQPSVFDSLPLVATAGTAKNFYVAVSNIGSASVVAQFNITFQRADDAAGTLNVSTIITRLFPALSLPFQGPPNASFWRGESYTFLPGDAGFTRYIRVCADIPPANPGVISESFENNNCGVWTPISVIAPVVPLPNYIVPLAPTPSAAPVLNVPLTFSAVVNNAGTAAVPLATLSQIRFQIDTGLAGSAYSAATVNRDTPVGSVPGLGVGGSSAAINSPAWTPLVAGTYKVRACADQPPTPSGVIAEGVAGELDNCGPDLQFVVSPPPTAPDLTTGAVLDAANNPPVSVVAGTPTTFKALVSNTLGTANAIAPFRTLLLEADDAAGTGARILTFFDNASTNVPMGLSIFITFGGAQQAVFPVGEAGQTKYIKACADQSFIGDLNGNIAELLGTNNCGPVWTPISVTPASYNLTVTNTGPGTVTSAPVGINCGATCVAPFNSGTVVTVTAPAVPGYSVAISNGCVASGAVGAGASCPVTMNAARTVNVVYTLSTPNLTISPAGTGVGTVTSAPAGINCGATCNVPFAYNTVVTLTAAPTAGSYFVGWSGAGCSGTGNCVVTMSVARNVTATFNLVTGTLTMSSPSCTIALNASTCTVTATWTTVGATTPSLVDANVGATLDSSVLNPTHWPNWGTPLTVWVANPSTRFELKNGGAVLDTEIVTASCAGGSSWDGSKCAPLPTAPLLTAGNCIILSGQSTCNSSMTWTILNATGPNLYNATRGIQYTTTPSGVGVPFAITFGANIIEARNNAVPLNTATAIATCAVGTAWNGTICVASLSSGTLTMSSPTCTIALNASTCTVTATWTTVGATTPSLVDANVGTTLDSPALNPTHWPNWGTPFTVWVTNPQTKFDLKDGAVVLDTETVTGICVGGTFWDIATSRCISGAGVPIISVTPPSPGTVTSGLMNYGTVFIGNPTPADRTFVISNVGPGTLNVTPTVTIDDPQITCIGCGVAYSLTGAAQAVLTIHYDQSGSTAGTGDSEQITFVGAPGPAFTRTIQGLPEFPPLLFLPDPLDFGSLVVINGKFKDLTFSIQNVGAAPIVGGTLRMPPAYASPLTASPFSCIGATGGHFSGGVCDFGTVGSPIPVNGIVTYTIRFQPDKVGVYWADKVSQYACLLPSYCTATSPNIRFTGIGQPPVFKVIEK